MAPATARCGNAGIGSLPTAAARPSAATSPAGRFANHASTLSPTNGGDGEQGNATTAEGRATIAEVVVAALQAGVSNDELIRLLQLSSHRRSSHAISSTAEQLRGPAPSSSPSNQAQVAQATNRPSGQHQVQATNTTNSPTLIHAQAASAHPQAVVGQKWPSDFNKGNKQQWARFESASKSSLPKPLETFDKDSIKILNDAIASHAVYHGTNCIFNLPSPEGEEEGKTMNVTESPSKFDVQDPAVRRAAYNVVTLDEGTKAGNEALMHSIRFTLVDESLKWFNQIKNEFTENGVELAPLAMIGFNNLIIRNANAEKRKIKAGFSAESLTKILGEYVSDGKPRPLRRLESHVSDEKIKLQAYGADPIDTDSSEDYTQNLVQALMTHPNREVSSFVARKYQENMDDKSIKATYKMSGILQRVIVKAQGLGLEGDDEEKVVTKNQSDDYVAMSVDRGQGPVIRNSNALSEAGPLATDRYHGYQPPQPQASSMRAPIPRAHRPETQASTFAAQDLGARSCGPTANGLTYGGARGRPSSSRDRQRRDRPGPRASTYRPNSARSQSGFGNRWAPSAPQSQSGLGNRWTPPAPPYEGERHTQNYRLWNRQQRPGDGRSIQVEVWIRNPSTGDPMRPRRVDHRTAYWCPHRNQYCYTDPDTYLSMIQGSQQQSAEDRYVASVAEATIQGRGGRARNQHQRPRHN